MSDNETHSLPSDVTQLLPEEVAATIELEWGKTAELPGPIDATIATRAAENTRPETIVVSERRVHDIQQIDPRDWGDADYELVSILGEGGMGVVYEARQTCIGRSVAVKMLNTPDDDATDTRQYKFLEEAAVTGELDHPNIVPIYDLGQTSDGAIFYAMKQVKGRRWKDVIRKRTLADNLHVLMRVADAVAFAHSRGVVHRDLKPENTMLGEFGEVLVMDWGLALVLSAQDAPGCLGGTPCYMAPEMVMGPLSAIGTHSDVYLLGAILYEIVTGTAPHAGPNTAHCLSSAALNQIAPSDQQGELVDVARKAMATDPADRFATVQEFQAAIRECESHTESLAATSRARAELTRDAAGYDHFSRALFGFQNAIDLWPGNTDAHAGLADARVQYAETALANGDYELGLSVLDGDSHEHAELRQQLVAAQQERDARKSRLRQVRRTAAGLAVGLAVVMAVALTWIMRAERRTREQRDIALIQQRLARDAVDQMLTEVGQQQLQDVPQTVEVRRNLLQKALNFYLRFLDEQPDDPSVRVETARAYHRVGDISTMLGQTADAESAYQRAVVLFEELATEFPKQLDYQRRLARTQNDLGEIYRTLGDSEGAEREYLAALQRQRVLVEIAPENKEHHQELARTSYNLGLHYWSIDRPDEARVAYDKAVDELQPLVDARHDHQDQQGLARAHLNRGILNKATGGADAARSDYDQAISLLAELVTAAPTKAEYRYELATVYNNLGNLLLPNAEQRAETEQVYKEGLSLLESLVDDYPSVTIYRKELANAVNSLAALSYFQEDFETAEQMWRRSRTIAADLVNDQPDVPEYHSLLGRTLGNLGSLMIRQGDHAEAVTVLTEAIASQRAALESNPDNPGFRTFLRNCTWTLTEAHLALRDHESAAATAAELPTILPDDPAELYRAAALIARCVPLATTEGSDSPEQHPYASRSLDFLEQAIAAGFDDVSKLEADEAFDAVRDEERFRHMLKK